MKSKLALVKNFKNEDFFKLIEKALKSNPELSKLCDKYKSEKNKYELLLNDGYYELKIEGQNGYVFFNISKRLENREYIINLTFECLKEQRNIYMEIKCVNGAIEFDRLPPFMLNIMNVVAKSEAICYSKIGKSGEVIIAGEENREEIIACINNYNSDIPLVLATEYNNGHAYEIDENKLSRYLAGFAYVVTADKAFIESINKEINAKLYNGTVVVYHRREHKVLRKEDKFFGESLNGFVFQHIRECSESVAIPNKTQKATIAINDEELKRQLKQEMEENARLKIQLDEARRENKALNKALEQAKNGKFAIVKPNEYYDGEVVDLIICALENEIKRTHDTRKRKLDLAKDIIMLNSKTANGDIFFDEVKSILYNGVDLKGSGFAKLEKLGFKTERDKVHNILKFDKYQFVTAKSTSDDRSGKNLYSNMWNTLCVY